MAIKTYIKDGTGTGYEAKVTQWGQLVTAPIDFSTAYNATAAVNDTAYNLVTPQTAQRFVITGITLYANQGVSNVTDATVIIYEASSASATTVDKAIITTNMVRADRVILTGIDIIVTEGKWINVKTTDNTVYATVLGYYVTA